MVCQLAAPAARLDVVVSGDADAHGGDAVDRDLDERPSDEGHAETSDRDDADAAIVAERFRRWSSTASGRLGLYARLCAGIAAEPSLHRLLLVAPPSQRLPVLLLAAVHFLVLGERDSALAQHYPNLTSPPDDGDPMPAFTRFCADHDGELRALLATRSTQTNEVGRCSLLLPAMALVAAETGPLAMVDVGTSAGLNLAIDRYRYEYRPGRTLGGDSTVTLACEIRQTRGDGAVPLPEAIPEISARVGLDRSPIDLHDPTQARWLEACVWPEQPERFHRLRAAIELVRAMNPPVRHGDAVDDLDDALGEVAGTGHPVVTNTWVLNYLDGAQRTAYVDRLKAHGADTDLSWIYAESPREVGPELPVPDDRALADGTVVTLVRWRGGRQMVDHLATAHPHGHWLSWI